MISASRRTAPHRSTSPRGTTPRNATPFDMPRASMTIFGEDTRKEIMRIIACAPLGARVQVNEPKRTTEQNSKMWAMLGELARGATLFGERYIDDEWKWIFMHALGKEMKFLRSLDGNRIIPYGARSSKMTIAEMSALIELMHAWAAQNDFKFSDELETA